MEKEIEKKSKEYADKIEVAGIICCFFALVILVVIGKIYSIGPYMGIVGFLYILVVVCTPAITVGIACYLIDRHTLKLKVGR